MIESHRFRQRSKRVASLAFAGLSFSPSITAAVIHS